METPTISKTESSQIIENESLWKHHLKLQKESGLSRTKYCRVNNLNYDRFGYWIHKWSRQKSSLVAVKLKSTNESTPQTILCTLELSNSRTLKIHDLKTLLFILEKIG